MKYWNCSRDFQGVPVQLNTTKYLQLHYTPNISFTTLQTTPISFMLKALKYLQPTCTSSNPVYTPILLLCLLCTTTCTPGNKIQGAYNSTTHQSTAVQQRRHLFTSTNTSNVRLTSNHPEHLSIYCILASLQIQFMLKGWHTMIKHMIEHTFLTTWV